MDVKAFLLDKERVSVFKKLITFVLFLIAVSMFLSFFSESNPLIHSLLMFITGILRFFISPVLFILLILFPAPIPVTIHGGGGINFFEYGGIIFYLLFLIGELIYLYLLACLIVFVKRRLKGVMGK
ncbi:MAG: hypothetical protein ABIA76_01800 [Candidatus Diapherotrites archaeon]